jgi:hypothetical protein
MKRRNEDAKIKSDLAIQKVQEAAAAAKKQEDDAKVAVAGAAKKAEDKKTRDERTALKKVETAQKKAAAAVKKAATETQLQEKVLAKFGAVEELRRDAVEWGLDSSNTAVMEVHGSRCGACNVTYQGWGIVAKIYDEEDRVMWNTNLNWKECEKCPFTLCTVCVGKMANHEKKCIVPVIPGPIIG